MIGSTVSFSDINTELGNSSTATVSLNDANPRWLSGVPSGTISASNFAGSARIPGALTSTYYSINLRSTQFVNGQLYLFGPNGSTTATDSVRPTILSSSSPSVNTSYTPQYLSNFYGIYKAILNGTTIIAVNAGGYVLKSTNGTSWSEVLVYNMGLFGITWVPAISKYIAVGSNKRIFTSSDAVSWTQQTSPTGGNSYDTFYTTASSGSVHIVAGTNNFIARSTDTTTWTKYSSGVGTSATSWNASARTGSLFVLVGSGGQIITSPDGITWTLRFTAASVLFEVSWNGSLLVAVGNSGYIATSPDGITWTPRTTPFAFPLYGACWSGSAWFVAGQKEAGTSTDGITWTKLSSDTQSEGQQIVQSNNLSSTFFVYFNHFTERFYSSVDGIAWTQRTLAANFICSSIAYFNSIWIAIGYHSSYGAGVYTSSDGLSWTLRATPAGTNQLRAIAYSGSRYVAVGDYGTVISSADAITWTNHSTANYELWCGVAWNGTKFVAVDDDSEAYNYQTVVLSSSNGTTWTSTIYPNIGPMKGMTSNGSQFFMTSTGEYQGVNMYVSSDGITITQDTATNSQNAGGYFGTLWWNGYDIWAGHGNGPEGFWRRERNGSAWVYFNQTIYYGKMMARAPTVVVSQTPGFMAWNNLTITTRI